MSTRVVDLSVTNILTGSSVVDPTGATDSSAVVQAAVDQIEYLASLNGEPDRECYVLYLPSAADTGSPLTPPPGYAFQYPVICDWSNVVISGDGIGLTRIVPQNSFPAFIFGFSRTTHTGGTTALSPDNPGSGTTYYYSPINNIGASGFVDSSLASGAGTLGFRTHANAHLTFHSTCFDYGTMAAGTPNWSSGNSSGHYVCIDFGAFNNSGSNWQAALFGIMDDYGEPAPFYAYADGSNSVINFLFKPTMESIARCTSRLTPPIRF